MADTVAEFYNYILTSNGVLFKTLSSGTFRSYNLASVTRAAYDGSSFKLYFGEDDFFTEAGPATDLLMRHYCRFAGLDSEPIAALVIRGGTAESIEKGDVAGQHRSYFLMNDPTRKD